MVRKHSSRKTAQRLASYGMANNCNETYNFLCFKHAQGCSCSYHFLRTTNWFAATTNGVSDALISFDKGSATWKFSSQFGRLKDAV